MDIVIKNGTLVFAEEMINGDIAVKDGKISAIGCGLEYPRPAAAYGLCHRRQRLYAA